MLGSSVLERTHATTCFAHIRTPPTGMRAASRGTVHDRASESPRCSSQPVEDDIRVSYRRSQGKRAERRASTPGEALNSAHKVRAAIRPGERVNFVDHHDPQVAEDRALVHVA